MQLGTSLNKTVTFFCDLHADAEAFLSSLKLGQLITPESTLQKVTLSSKGRQGQIIIGGDCFDKGPSNLALLDLLGELKKQQANLVLLAGNHDVRVYAGLLALDVMDDLRQSHFFVRMGRKAAPFLAEIYHNYCQDDTVVKLADSLILDKLFPEEQWFEHFPNYAQSLLSPRAIQKEVRQIKTKKHDFLAACGALGLNLKQIYQAALKAQELFIRPNGRYAWYFQSLQLMHQSGNYLFSHAGIDDEIAHQMTQMSVATLNQQFQQSLREGLIFEMYYSAFGNVFRTKYRDKDYPLTEQGSAYLKQQQIYALVNGHRSHQNGQQLFVRAGLLNFECDTQLNRNCRTRAKMKTLGEAVTVFAQDGTVHALGNDLPQPKTFHPSFLATA